MPIIYCQDCMFQMISFKSDLQKKFCLTSDIDLEDSVHPSDKLIIARRTLFEVFLKKTSMGIDDDTRLDEVCLPSINLILIASIESFRARRWKI